MYGLRILYSHCISFDFRSNPLILGANNCNLPVIVQIIAEALHRDVIDKEEEVKARMLNIIKQIMVSHMLKICLDLLCF